MRPWTEAPTSTGPIYEDRSTIVTGGRGQRGMGSQVQVIPFSEHSFPSSLTWLLPQQLFRFAQQINSDLEDTSKPDPVTSQSPASPTFASFCI